MQELIQSLQEKVGLTADQAQAAAGHFVDFIKSKVPDSLHGPIDDAVSGAGTKLKGFAEEAENKISGLFGSK